MARIKKKGLNTSEEKRERVRLISGAGDEPKFGGLTWTQLDLAKALNYYAMHTDFSKMKAWAVEFVKNYRPELLNKVEAAPDFAFMTYGPLCRLHQRGFSFDNVYLNRIFQYFDSFAFHVKPETPEKVKVKPEKINKSQEAFDASLDNILETGKCDLPTFDPTDNLKDIKAYTEKELLNLKEAPEYYKLDHLTPLKTFFKEVKEKIEGILEAKKKKAPVVQKRKTPTEIVKNVKYQKSEPKLKLTSVNPIDVLDRRKIYVYDTEKRRLIKYVAATANFTFTGTTLQNFDPEKSVSKTIRKPEEFFHGRDMSISAMNKAFDVVRAVEKPMTTGRFSDSFLILNKS